ncbi:hypothetical protein MMARJ_45760 [Mycobacterium marseillense]|uniref:Uncharacterized protein n=1 Tax=Mycobacterium marseillense TaxID=701042 RepID=A0ABM7JIJ2_9MYCO|nr:hypothetical protein MMARJ_45760 [Mycobacterium marseillense]
MRINRERHFHLMKLCGAKGNRTPDLLDANESTWAFGTACNVGRVKFLQVDGLATLGTKEP